MVQSTRTDVREADESKESAREQHIHATSGQESSESCESADATRPAGATAASEATPLTRRQLREMARGPAVPPTADLERIVASADETSFRAVEDEPAVLPAVDVVEVAAAKAADPAGIVASEADDAAFVEAVLADDDEAHAILDEFEVAARLFAFTGETPVQVAAAAIGSDELDAAAEPVRTAATRRRRFTGAAFRRATAASASVGAMGLVGLLAVGLTTPAEAIAGSGNASLSIAAASTSSVAVPEEEIQAYVAPADAESSALERSDYSTAVTATPAQIAAQSGISTYSNFFTNDPDAAVQWPFAVGVSLSYGYGMRSGGMHEGLDFTPGNGAQIQAVADGTVRIATESGGGYGVMVIIDHVIDGELVSTRYGHMQYGSLRVRTGETVEVGQVIGLVGNTGHSFGAHLHFELLVNGTTPIDPLPWLRQHAGG